MILLKPDICVIGAGSAGLSVASGAAQLGMDTVLIEAHKMGGDCLNYGCVPSKALLAAAHAASFPKKTLHFGVAAQAVTTNRSKVRDYVQKVIAGIAPHDSVERFEGLGVRVIREFAKFVSPKALIAGDYQIEAGRFVIATGARAVIPPILGINDIPYLTNETIFDAAETMPHLLVLGGGPIGVELAQANARLGSKVTIIEMDHLLPQDDIEAVAILRKSLRSDGIDLLEEAKALSALRLGDGSIQLALQTKEGEKRIIGSHLLIAAGRKPMLDGMGLEEAGIAYTAKGVKVDRGLRSSNRRVYALGDAIGGPAFTHVAGYHAGIFIRRALFKLPARVDYRTLPWVTYTDPELAQLGLTEKEARRRHGDCQIVRLSYEENDRARTEGKTEGFIKIIATKKGHILGVTIVGAQAGELLAPWCLAMKKKMKLSAMADILLPYPTLSELSKRAAGHFYQSALFSPRTRHLVRFLRLFD